MPSLVVPQGGLLRLIWTFSGAPYAVNVFGVRNATGAGITQAAANSLGAAVKTAMTSTGYHGWISNLVALQTVGLRNINTANQVEFLDTGAAVVGTDVSNALPPQVALCVTLRTALAGRSFRGRTFLPGFAEATSDVNGRANSATGDAALAFVQAIMAACSAASLPMAIISRPRPAEGTVPAYAGNVTNVTAAVVRDLVWDTQRRRAVPGI